MRRSIGLLLAMILVGPASQAAAVCASGVYFCVCGWGDPDAVLEGVIVEPGRDESQVRVDHVHGGSSLEEGDVVRIFGDRRDAVGREVLMHVHDDNIGLVHRLDARGGVTCSENDVQVDLELAIELAFAPDCPVRLREHGYREAPCNDTGCSTSTGGSKPLAALLLGVAALRARRLLGLNAGRSLKPRAQRSRGNP